MTQPFQSGRIGVHDIDELNLAVAPWQLDMRQISPGKFHAQLDFAQFNGILLTRERWSQRVSASGTSPTDYLALAGPCTERSFQWCGKEIDSQTVIHGFGTDTDFQTPVSSDHWVILVPEELLISNFGEESAANMLGKRNVVSCQSRQSQRLASLVKYTIGESQANRDSRADQLMFDDIESELLGTIAEVLLGSDTDGKVSTPRRRYLACRRAISYAENLRSPVRVPHLAAAVGVSQRVLELGFKETLGMSPRKFLRWSRLNHLHRELRDARAGTSTVTEIAGRWGFGELGRTAVEYKQLFGESPSSTLRQDSRLPSLRYAELLHEASSD